MHQAFGTHKVLADVAFKVYFIFADMADLSDHIATVLLPGDVLGESDSNLSEDGVRVIIRLRLVHIVEGMELVLVGELADKHALE